MFFIGGIMDGQKQFAGFRQVITCTHCGQYAALDAFMTYTYLMFFFIPIFKWNKRYWVRSTCCGTVWQISAEKGDSIARGESVTLAPADLTPTGNTQPMHRCAHCGFTTWENFTYCPHCGKPF